MSKEKFRLLFHPPIEEDKDHKKDVEREVKSCEGIELKYKVEVERLEEEIKKLKLIIRELEDEKNRLLEDKKKLLEELEEKNSLEKLVNYLSKKIVETIEKAKFSVKKEVIDLIKDLTKRILLSDYLPKEEMLIRALSMVFESGIDLKGQVNLYLNPKDFQRIGPYLEKLKEQTGELLYLNPLVKSELSEGEFLLETQRIWIERRYEDLLQDLLNDMRDERGLQDIS